MAYYLHITAKALCEIDEAMAWRSQRSVARAVRWYIELMEAVRSLADDPERCAAAPQSAWCAGVRQLLHGKKRGTCRILFEIRGDTVFILRVRSAAQDLLGPDDL